VSNTSGGWERYLPQDRRATLLGGPALPDRALGAALLADISGFTSLTTSLVASLGPRRGAEELILQINRVYDALITEIEKFGGSVIDFAGDAILCWFDSARMGDGLGMATLAAVGAGYALQEAIRRFARVDVAGGAEVGISLKVAIASGEARRLVVGDPDIQLLDVLAGSTLDRLGEVASSTTSGEVRLDEAAARVIAPLDAARLEVPAATPVSLPSDAVLPWIPRSIRAHLAQGQESFLADLRPAIAAFILVPGLDYADAGAGEKLDGLIRWAQSRATAWDGLLLQVTTGDKGTYLYMVFGAPVSHEDDAIRAVHASLEIRDLPDDLAWARGLQIGLTRGVMRTGTYGGATRRSWGVMGNDVNLAARLMMRAGRGQIVISAAVAAELRGRFDVRDLPPMTLKGMPAPVKVFEVSGPMSLEVGSTGEWSRATAMVGRAREQALLLARLEALADGAGSVAVILGDPGIGKSHLLRHTLTQARTRGVTALAGAASALERSALYLAWRPIFARLLALPEAPIDPSAREEFLAARLEDDERSLLPLLSAVLPFPIADNATTATMGGQVRAETTRALLAGILTRVGGREPLCIAIEDAHWMDSASWALLQRVMSAGTTLVLLTSRSIEAGSTPELSQLLALPGIERIDLAALTGADSLRLACERLGGHVAAR
jgi:class 3 adenylate cyclase